MSRSSRFLPLFVPLLCVVVPVAAAAQAFESWDDRRASEILRPNQLSGPHHRVQERVVSDGFQHHFVVDSDAGRFTAQGDAMLRRLINEIYAIIELKKISQGKAFADATVAAAGSPLKAAKNLVTDPVDTLSGVPQGVFSVFARVGERFSSDKTEYEDGGAKALLAVSSFKREYARRLNVDVYSSNKALQTELNRLGWAGAAGNLTPSLALSAAGGPAVVALQQLRHVQQLNDLIKELPPGELNRRNRATLKKMGIEEALIERFMDHKIFSPRHKTVLVESLASLGSARGRGLLIRQALRAESEVDALFYQQVAETFAGYHRTISPLRELAVHNGLAIAYAQNATLVVAFPLDYGRWTSRSAPVARNLAANYPKRHGVKTIDVWVTGRFSDRAKREFAALGIKVTENIDERVGLMD